jgi:plasmid stabilization system protein ParE
MRRLLYTDEAIGDLADIAEFIADESNDPLIADSFVAKIRQKCVQLAGLPGLMGQARASLRPDIRSTPFRGYIIFFRYVGDILEVVNILDAHRDMDDHFS